MMSPMIQSSPMLPARFVAGSIAFAALGTLIFMAGAALMAGGDPGSHGYRTLPLILHIATVIPAFFLGGVILLIRKGTALHKMLGRVWAALMMVTAISSFWLTGLTGGFSPIHIFSVVTIVSIPWGIYCAIKGDIESHKRAMTGPYIGLVIAGAFAFLPGRLMGELVASLF